MEKPRELTSGEGKPFTDQEDFPEPMIEKVAEYDQEPSWEVDAGAIFKTAKGEYRGVVISGCS